ncbi:MAG: hypothetical protein R3D59_04255 [Paracoccaceae bacterium]|nr:hypothetical protein [Maritimibacter sp.]
MFGTDEFGNTRLLPFAFVVVLTVLGIGVIATSQTMWSSPDPVVVGALSFGS